jgi:hypothetical protein
MYSSRAGSSRLGKEWHSDGNRWSYHATRTLIAYLNRQDQRRVVPLNTLLGKAELSELFTHLIYKE